MNFDGLNEFRSLMHMLEAITTGRGIPAETNEASDIGNDPFERSDDEFLKDCGIVPIRNT
jgi:hypothetical protein